MRNPDCARSWLLTILRNRFLKDGQRPQATPATNVGLNLDMIPMESREVLFNGEIDHDRIQEALREIPPDFRLVLAMYYFEDCSYREIAAELNLPIGTVMSRLARAKGHLRTKLFQPAIRPVRRPRPSVAR